MNIALSLFMKGLTIIKIHLLFQAAEKNGLPAASLSEKNQKNILTKK